MSWDITGHSWAVHLLQQHIARGEVRHAYLFTGQQGVGRRSLALQFARALNCTNPPTSGGSCGECRACEGIAQSSHPDLTIIQRLEDKTRILIDQIRNLQHTLILAPYESRYRIALLVNFHEATDEAQNALLKTLEEAPEKVILLLTAESPESLLPTIVSRCELMRLRPMPLEELEEVLKKERKVGNEEARLYSHLAQGCPGQAINILENPALLTQRRSWLDDALRLLSASRHERFRFAERESKNRNDLKQILQTWMSLWRDLMIVSEGAPLPLINLDYQSQLERLAVQVSAAIAQKCIAGLDLSLDRIEKNANPRLLLEVLLLDWPFIKT